MKLFKGKDAPSESDAPAEPEALGAAEPVAPSLLSDEGVLYEWLTDELIVNFADDLGNARRTELHIKGQSYMHVAETCEGQWIYRHDS